MTLPTTEVAVSFTTDPLAVPSWTTITDRALKAVIEIGKQQATDSFQPGTARVTFDNDDRRFDPLHAAGPYFGNLKPNKRIRIRSTWSGSTFELFTGFVDGWPQSYADQSTSRVELPATDAFKLLNRKTFTRSAYGYDTVAAVPSFWYPLGDTSGTAMECITVGVLGGSGPVAVVSPGFFGSYSVDVGAPSGPGSSSLSVAGIVPGDEPASAMGDSVAWSGTIPVPLAQDGYGGKMGFEVTIQNKATGFVGVVIASPDSTSALSIVLGQLLWRNGGFSCSSTGGALLDDGLPHQVFVTADVTGASLKIYIDGVDRSGATTGSAIPIPTSTTATFRASAVANTFTLQDFVYWPGLGPVACPSPAQIAARFPLWAAPWAGEKSGPRIVRLLDAAGWPSGERSIDAGLSPMGAAVTMGRKALQAAEQVEQTEQGWFYVDHANGGKVRFRDRLSMLTDTATSLVTFSDDPAGSNHYENLDLVYDEQLVVNEVIVTWAGGQVVVADLASQAANGIQSFPVDSVAATLTDATDLANWCLAHGKDLFLRVKSLTLNPSADPTGGLFFLALGLQLSNRITVVRRPQNIGAAITIDALIEGIRHEVDGDAGTWITKLSLSQADTQGYWIAGVALAGVDTRAGF